MAPQQDGAVESPTSRSSSGILPLPDLPENQRGTSVARSKHYKAEVSNANGYLCHIHLEVDFEVPPDVLFQIFVHPDNAGVFRDIKQVGYRKVLDEKPGWKMVEVEQCGELRVMFVHRVFRTYLTVEEDSRDPECLTTSFKLLRSDILGRFQGTWHLYPMKDDQGKVVGTKGVLEQDILPKGVPPFFAHMPVLGGLLRRVSLNAISRLVEDITLIVDRYKVSPPGTPLDAVMRKIAVERGHIPAEGENFGQEAVNSFALNAFSASSSSSSEEEEEAEAAAAVEAAEGMEVDRGGAAAAAGGAGAGAAAAASLVPSPGAHHHHHVNHRSVGMNVDVTVDGKVHVDLVPNPSTVPEVALGSGSGAAGGDGGGGCGGKGGAEAIGEGVQGMELA